MKRVIFFFFLILLVRCKTVVIEIPDTVSLETARDIAKINGCVGVVAADNLAKKDTLAHTISQERMRENERQWKLEREAAKPCQGRLAKLESCRKHWLTGIDPHIFCDPQDRSHRECSKIVKRYFPHQDDKTGEWTIPGPPGVTHYIFPNTVHVMVCEK